jgi:hypothetical protein
MEELTLTDNATLDALLPWAVELQQISTNLIKQAE